jgi:hypothetical protein
MPYVEIATENIIVGTNNLGIKVELIDFKNREELLELSPTPYILLYLKDYLNS